MSAPWPKNAPATPAGKPYRVTAYKGHWYWGTAAEEQYWERPTFVVGDFRHYWQANAVSWIYHHILRYGCNTWMTSPERELEVV